MNAKFKIEFITGKHSKGSLVQEYDCETGEISFSGKIKIDRNTKEGKKIFYYSFIDKMPITSYFFNRTPYRKVGGEKEEADEKVKKIFEINMNED